MKNKFLIIALWGILISCGESKFPGFEKSEKGLYYQIVSTGEGKQVMIDDILTLELKYKTSKDSMLYNSENVPYPTQLKVAAPVYDGDVMEGFAMLKEGGEAMFKTSADSFFKKIANIDLPVFIDSATYLTFEVKVLKVQTMEEIKAEKEAEAAVNQGQEIELIKTYLEENNISESARESGLYFIPRSPGNGKIVARGSTVKVHYLGRLLTGEKFDSSYDRGEPIEFTLGMGRVIPGWDEGIGYMSVGSKATMIIPSALAYGDSPPPGGVIKPYSPLVFDVELIEAK